MGIDIQRLKDAADSYTVAQFIGMEIIDKGKYKYIRCPGHLNRLGKEDKKISNAILTDYGYHCFACSCGVSVFNMVQEFLDCDFGTALRTVAEAMGGADIYSVERSPFDKHNKNELTLPLTVEEIHKLGFCLTVRIDSSIPYPAKNLNSFYNKHRDLCKNMLLGRCISKIKEYEEKIKKLDRSNPEFKATYDLLDFGEGVPDTDLIKIKNNIIKTISEYKEIRKKIEKI